MTTSSKQNQDFVLTFYGKEKLGLCIIMCKTNGIFERPLI